MSVKLFNIALIRNPFYIAQKKARQIKELTGDNVGFTVGRKVCRYAKDNVISELASHVTKYSLIGVCKSLKVHHSRKV